MPLPIPPLALGAVSAALLALTKSASSSSGGGNNVAPVPNKPDVNPSKRKTRPDPFPPTAGEAIVLTSPGMKARKGPGTNTDQIAPEGVTPNDAFVNTHIAVFETGVQPTDGQGGEWWKIMTPGGGIGYVRAVDAQGVKNVNLIVPIPGGAVVGPDVAGRARIAGQFGMSYDTMGKGTLPGTWNDPRLRRAAPAPVPGPYSRYISDLQRLRRAPAAPAPRSNVSAFQILSQLNAQRNAAVRGAPRIGQDASTPMVFPGPTSLATSLEHFCQGPNGCALRSAPDVRAAALQIVPPGAKVIVDDFQPGNKCDAASPGPGGWAKVRFFANGSGVPVEGHMLAEWLVAAATAADGALQAVAPAAAVGASAVQFAQRLSRSPLPPVINPRAAPANNVQSVLRMNSALQSALGREQMRRHYYRNPLSAIARVAW